MIERICLVKNKINNPKKIAWITLHDPRLSSESKIINKNINIIHSNPISKEIFPKEILNTADRRRILFNFINLLYLELRLTLIYLYKIHVQRRVCYLHKIRLVGI